MFVVDVPVGPIVTITMIVDQAVEINRDKKERMVITEILTKLEYDEINKRHTQTSFSYHEFR